MKRLLSKANLLAPLKRAHGFGRDERAAAGVEFGLLAIPFFAIIGAIVETALVFFAGEVLDGAVQDASRIVLTGQAKTQSFNAVKFKAAVCDHTFGLIDCSQIKIKTSVVANFNAAAQSSPLDSTGGWKPDWLADRYDGGVGRDVIMVEAYYKWQPILNIGGFSLQNTADGKRLLASVKVFRNEPF
jgi:hypothetical protein